MTQTVSNDPPKTTWPQEEFEATAERMRGQAVEVFTKDGYHSPMAFLFTTINPENGKNERSIIPVMAAQFSEDAHKGAFAYAIKTIAAATKAVGIVFITEIWMRTVDATPDMRKMAKSELETFLANQTRPSESPDRKEALFMSIEHSRFGAKAFYADILRDAEGKPSVAEWRTYPGGNMTGRFIHLLPQVA